MAQVGRSINVKIGVKEQKTLVSQRGSATVALPSSAAEYSNSSSVEYFGPCVLLHGYIRRFYVYVTVPSRVMNIDHLDSHKTPSL
jgi:hypothetical protein